MCTYKSGMILGMDLFFVNLWNIYCLFVYVVLSFLSGFLGLNILSTNIIWSMIIRRFDKRGSLSSIKAMSYVENTRKK